MNQILDAFGHVRNSLQFLVNSWTTIVELLSIYKRLRAFEAAIKGEALPSIDRSSSHGEREEAAEPVLTPGRRLPPGKSP